MKKLKNWIFNLKIKTKLFLLLFFTIFNFLLFFALVNYNSNTTRTFIWTVDTERLHTQYFEMGLANFFIYLDNNDSSYFNLAVENVEKANRLASIMVNIDSLVKNTTEVELYDIYWDYYKEPLHYDREATDLFADRTIVFVRLQFSILLEVYDIAAKGHETGKKVIELFNDYKQSPSTDILDKIKVESETIRIFYNDFSEKVTEATNFGMRLQFIFSIVILLLLIVLTVLAINKLSKHLHSQLKLLVSQTQELGEGNLNIEIRKKSNDEIGWLFEAFSSVHQNLKNMVTYASEISSGNYNKQIQPRSKNDELAHALNIMATSLQENKVRNEKETWQTQGINLLNNELGGNLTTEEFSKKALSFLINYLNGISGNLYIMSNEALILSASSGMNQEKVCKNIEIGSGIVGQAVANKKPITISNLENNYYSTFTSTGDIFPKQLIIIPLLFDDTIIGAIELTSIHEYTTLENKFINSAILTISTGLHVAISRKQQQQLLKTSQKQAEELEVQQEELRTTNTELEEYSQILRNNEIKMQTQQEELRVTNEELEERTQDLEIQKDEVLKNSKELGKAKKVVEQKAREVEIASKYKSEFLANMSHELRTPLNSLLILSKNLSNNKEENLNNKQIEAAKIIYNSGNDLLDLINDILDLSKIEAGKMTVNPEYVTISEIAIDIMSMFKHVAETKNIEFVTQIENGNEKTNVYADRQKIEQVLKNLISNAIKFTLEGGVTVRFKITDKEMLSIEVVDTGIGIPKNRQIEIFEAFQQVDGSTSRNYGGTGLGLSISRELTKLLGGKITLKSNEGSGSVFTVSIPVNYSKPKDDESGEKKLVSQQQSKKLLTLAKTKVNQKHSGQTHENKDDNGIIFIKDDRNTIKKNDKVILIIEDDLVLAKDLANKCFEDGFKSIISGNGENGLFLAEKYQPDAIILDIILPGIDGYKVLEILKENPDTRHIPVQMMSSSDPDLVAMQKLAIGFLSKPLTQKKIKETLDKISNHLDKNIKDLLIIEDDEANRIMISKLLGGKGVNVSVTDSGKKAIEMLSSNKYDCVVLDLGLTDMHGLDLLHKISEEHKNNLPPIIVYTGRDLTKEETKEILRYTKSIILKGIKSNDRLLDETALFLHRVVDDMQEHKKQVIMKLHNKEAMFDKKTVLIVDDDMRNVFALTKVFEDHNLVVIEAENGQIALDVLKKGIKPDIVLMDVMMPVMDGLTATKKIREIPEHNNLPIIILTAKAMKEDRIKAIDAGANDYLSKPVDTDKLLSLMRVWLYNTYK